MASTATPSATSPHDGHGKGRKIGLLVGAIGVVFGIFAVMTTWKRGRRELVEKSRATMLPLDAFLADIEMTKPHRVRGTAVFMTSSAVGTPPALLHHFKHNQSLHEQLILLTVESAPVPEVAAVDRMKVFPMREGVTHVSVRYGFMEQPNIPRDLHGNPDLHVARTSYHLGRETLLPAALADA